MVWVVVGVSAASPCVAEDGDTLFHWCENLPDAAMGYIVGVADALSARRGLHFCMPERVTRGQLQEVVCGYRRRLPVMSLSMSALPAKPAGLCSNLVAARGALRWRLQREG